MTNPKDGICIKSIVKHFSPEPTVAGDLLHSSRSIRLVIESLISLVNKCSMKLGLIKDQRSL